MDEVDVVLANNDRVTLRVGEAFLKVDADQRRAQTEVQAMRLAPVPTPEVLWHQPPVLALKALRGRTLGRLGEPSTASPTAWAAVGAAVRSLHDAPLPPWPETSVDALAERLGSECEWLIAQQALPTDVVNHNRRLAERVLRPCDPAFIHGDLHLEHVFVDGAMVTGIIDWSDARRGDPLFDIASLTLANDEHLDDFLAGYGDDVDRSIIAAWWSWRCLIVIRWLTENGYGAPDTLPEAAILRTLA